MTPDQVAIFLLGPLSVWLSQDPRISVQRFACFFGLGSQPFWFYATYTAEQWGMFAVCFIYAWAWARGLYHHWLKGRFFGRDST